MNKSRRGDARTLIVSIEGVDQAGKGTQSRMLAQRLRRDGISARVFGFPDYTTATGRRIRDALRDRDAKPEALHALMAENRREKLDEINRELDRNLVLVMDRYCESNIVYGLANNMEREWLEGMDSGMPGSDLVILLDIDAAESFRRKGRRDAFEANAELMESVVELYRLEAERSGWVVVDGSSDPGAVHRQIWDAVRAGLEGAGP